MCHISIKFQDKNYFLKLWKLTQECCVPRNKGLCKNEFKIEIFIKISGYSVKFAVLKIGEKQINKFYRNVILFAAVGLRKKFWHNAMAGSATLHEPPSVSRLVLSCPRVFQAAPPPRFSGKDGSENNPTVFRKLRLTRYCVR